MASSRNQKAAIAASFPDHLAWLSIRMPPALLTAKPTFSERAGGADEAGPAPLSLSLLIPTPRRSNWNSTLRILLFDIIIIIIICICIALVLILDYWFFSPVSTVCPPSLERHSCIRQLDQDLPIPIPIPESAAYAIISGSSEYDLPSPKRHADTMEVEYWDGLRAEAVERIRIQGSGRALDLDL